jgi:hypothetical protein
VAPRFHAVDPDMTYDEARGYGWVSNGTRTAQAIPLAPYLEVRSALSTPPTNLPHDMLYRDFIRWTGGQVFRVKTGPGDFTVHVLHPDRSEAVSKLKATGDYLDIDFPAGEWSVSGLVVQGAKSSQPLPTQWFPRALPRPSMSHQPPQSAIGGNPLQVSLHVAPGAAVTAVRLYYRPVNQQTKYKMLENHDGSFTVPGEDISPKWDLIYYFEVLNSGGGGWLQPDPMKTTPYFVVHVQ